jgi:DNA-binding CsgD family transcriptional regulator
MADPTGPDLPVGLNEREYAIAQEMIFGAKPTPIAAKLNLTRQTVWEVMQRPHVRQYVDANIEHVRLGNLRLITSAVGTAIATLVEICSDKTAAKPVRVSAAGHLVRAGIIQRHEISGPEGAPIPVQTTHILDGAEPKDVQELVAELRRKRLTG